MLARGLDLARPGKAAHEQFVRRIIEPVQGERPGGQRRAVKRSTGRQRRQRRIPQHGLAQTRKAPALDQKPRLEVRPGARIYPLEQLAASERGIGVAGGQHKRIHRGARRQPQVQWVSPQSVGDPERAT